jgi:hypothetical protein
VVVATSDQGGFSLWADEDAGAGSRSRPSTRAYFLEAWALSRRVRRLALVARPGSDGGGIAPTRLAEDQHSDATCLTLRDNGSQHRVNAATESGRLLPGSRGRRPPCLASCPETGWLMIAENMTATLAHARARERVGRPKPVAWPQTPSSVSSSPTNSGLNGVLSRPRYNRALHTELVIYTPETSGSADV